MIWGFVGRMARSSAAAGSADDQFGGDELHVRGGVRAQRRVDGAAGDLRLLEAVGRPVSSLFLRFDFEWSNFATAITDGGILKAIVNSVIITLCSTVITCLVGAAAAYPLARRQTRGNKLVSAGILAIMMIPPLSILVPLYSFLVQIGGVNSYWGIVLVLSTTNLPLAIFLYTAFIRATHRCWRSMRWDCTVAPRCGGTVSYPTMAMWPPDWTGHPDSSWITSRRSTAAG